MFACSLCAEVNACLKENLCLMLRYGERERKAKKSLDGLMIHGMNSFVILAMNKAFFGAENDKFSLGFWRTEFFKFVEA